MVFTWLCFNVDIYTTSLPNGIKVLKSWLIISLVQSYMNITRSCDLMLAGSYHGRNQTMMMRCWDLKKKPNNYMNCKSFIWVILTLCCVIVSKIQIPVDYAVLYQALLCYLKLCCVTSCLAVWLLALLCDLLLAVWPSALLCDLKLCCVMTSCFAVWPLALLCDIFFCSGTCGTSCFDVWY